MFQRMTNEMTDEQEKERQLKKLKIVSYIQEAMSADDLFNFYQAAIIVGRHALHCEDPICFKLAEDIYELSCALDDITIKSGAEPGGTGPNRRGE